MQKSTRAVLIAAVLAATLCSAQTAFAGSDGLGQFLPDDRAFLSSPDYLSFVKAQFLKYEPAVRMSECKVFTPSERMSVTLLDHLMRGAQPDGKTGLAREKEFASSHYSDAYVGAWSENWAASMCGQTVLRGLAILKKKDGTLDVMPQVPGRTRADLRLQIDTLKIGLPAFLLPRCEVANFAVLDTEVVDVVLPVKWTEKWTLTRCGKAVSRIVTYMPTADGGANIMVPAEDPK
jgi:hypothetical protein